MSADSALGLQGDSLYYESRKFINLATRTLPLSDEDEPKLKELLDIVRDIMNQTMESVSESEAEDQNHGWTTNMVDYGFQVISKEMKRDANIIAQQIAVEDGKLDDYQKTWEILRSQLGIPLKTKAILTLVAFATMYGKLWLITLVQNSNQLSKLITLLKQQPDIQVRNNRKKWFEAISRVMKQALELADCVLRDLKEPAEPSTNNMETRTQLLLSTAVCRIVNIVVICWSQAVTIIIKHNECVLFMRMESPVSPTIYHHMKDVSQYLWVLNMWEMELKKKRREIEGRSTEDREAHHGQVPIDEQAQAPSLSEGPIGFYNCWQNFL